MTYSDEKDLQNFKKVNTSSWDTLKDNVFIRVMNAKYIPSYNEDIAFVKKIDLAITFSVQEIVTTDSKKKMLSHMLTNQEISNLGVTKDDVYDCAMKNTATNRKRRIMTFKEYGLMHNLMYPMLTIPKNISVGSSGKSASEYGVFEDVTYDSENENKISENILIVTNKNDIFGASYLAVPNVLEEVYSRFNENFYILPLSIHCLMCVRNGYVTKNNTKPLYEVEDDILDTLEEFNDSQNKTWKDILSYKAYYYMGDDGKFLFPISTH